MVPFTHYFNLSEIRGDMKRLIITLVVICASTSTALAEPETVASTVKEVMVNEVGFGTCMARVDQLAWTTVSCRSKWMSFSCDGEFNSKAAGTLKYNNALAALVTGRRIRAVIDDDYLTDEGYCFAVSINVQ